MEEFAHAGSAHKDLVSLNTVRKSKQLLHLSDIVCCDGRTVDRDILTREPGAESCHGFPVEWPVAVDYKLWDHAIRAISSSTYFLPEALGPFLKSPHQDILWRTSSTNDRLYRIWNDCGDDAYNLFTAVDMAHNTRYGHQYTFVSTEQGQPPGDYYASVSYIDNDTVRFHSKAVIPCPAVVPTDFWSVLRSFSNQSLWKHFHCDGDGEWIHQGLLLGSLVAVHDGSYMPSVSTNVCSAAFYIYCRHTKNVAKGSVAEHSSSADNYRAEILGGILVQLVLRAASRRLSSPYMTPTVHCDNMGVVKHGNTPNCPLPAKQAQSDALRSYKQLIRDNPFPCKYEWVEGHSYERKGWDNCTLVERMNHKSDRLAKTALIAGFGDEDYISSDFPFEPITVKLHGKKVTGSMEKDFESHWGAKTARAFFHRKQIVDKFQFHLI